MTVAWMAAAATVAVLAAVPLGLMAVTWLVVRRIEARCPSAGRWIDLPGGRLHYTDVGRGPAIVLVHGLGGNLANFSRPLLAALAADFRLLAIDRSGSGYSPRRDGADAHLPRQAALVADFIAALRLQRPLLVGHSLGGAIALATALDHPALVCGLALLAPLTSPDATTPPVADRLIALPTAWRRVIAWTVALPLAVCTRKATLRRVFAPDRPPADFGSSGGGWLSCRPTAVDAALGDLGAVSTDLPALAARYGELKLPIGVLFGTADSVLPYRVHGVGLQAHVPQATLDVLEGLGHMLPVTAPERCATFIRHMAARTAA